MTEESRKESQKHYIECCQRKGWMDKDWNHLWPATAEARSDMGRGLFGLALVSKLDAIFTNWRERAHDVKDRTQATPGSIVDNLEKEWGAGFATMSEEQKAFTLRVVDDVLNSVAHSFCIMLDRFDHGDLDINLTPKDEDDEPKFTVPIQPHGFLEMFQDQLQWREEFGKRRETSRPAREETPAFMKPVQPDEKLAVIVGSQPITRTELTKRLWDYIKAHNLQDAKKKTIIHADAALKAVFDGKDQVTMFEMTKLVSGHFRE